MDLRSPVILAAGTHGTLTEILAERPGPIGALVSKSITREPRGGNRPWRVAPVAAGMLNAIGLANPGVEAFVERYADAGLDGIGCHPIASVAGFSVDDYAHVAEQIVTRTRHLRDIELNVSCPNVHGGAEFGADPVLLREVVGAVRPSVPGTLLVKLPPIAVAAPHSIVDVATAAIESGADALTLCNTTPAMAIDVDTREPAIGNVTGGLSGPAVHPIVTRLIHLVYRGIARDAGVPIIGCGGVQSWRDAAEFVLAGASAVMVGTGLFVSPKVAGKVARGLDRWAQRQPEGSVPALVGKAKLD